ncbi:hypothetical protein B0H14DRAFT_2574155 [Mycena olivaceomarginata]|nr:hypothetical protein B0H14DRAFT_2574155 [Mycena olivaceomarginata]
MVWLDLHEGWMRTARSRALSPLVPTCMNVSGSTSISEDLSFLELLELKLDSRPSEKGMSVLRPHQIGISVRVFGPGQMCTLHWQNLMSSVIFNSGTRFATSYMQALALLKSMRDHRDTDASEETNLAGSVSDNEELPELIGSDADM